MPKEFELKNDGTEPLYIQSWTESRPRVIRPILEWQHPDTVPCRVGLCGFNPLKLKIAQTISKETELPLIQKVTKTIDRAEESLVRIDRHLAVYLTQLYEEMKLGEFVSDNTTMDVLAQLWFDVEKKKIPYTILNSIISNFTSTISCSQYTAVFYIPPADTKRAKDLDRYLRRILDNFMVDFLPLIGDVNIKAKIAVNHLEDLNIGYNGDDDDDEE